MYDINANSLGFTRISHPMMHFLIKCITPSAQMRATRLYTCCNINLHIKNTRPRLQKGKTYNILIFFDREGGYNHTGSNKLVGKITFYQEVGS